MGGLAVVSNQMKISIETGGWCVARDRRCDDKLVGKGAKFSQFKEQEGIHKGAFQGKKSPRNAMSSQGT